MKLHLKTLLIGYSTALLKRLVFLFFGLVLLLSHPQKLKSEGSGTWGTDPNRQSMLWVPSSRTVSGQGGEGWFTSGYRYRGFMMLPSTADNTFFPNYNTNYDPQHRVFVYVRNGETVFWGFRLTAAIRRRTNVSTTSNNITCKMVL